MDGSVGGATVGSDGLAGAPEAGVAGELVGRAIETDGSQPTTARAMSPIHHPRVPAVIRAKYARSCPRLASSGRTSRVAGGEGAPAGAGGDHVAEQEGARLGKGSAADLLSAWRAAERDRAAAEESASVASLARAAAAEAETAAIETAEAARLSLEAAQRAENAARRTADAAKLAAKSASRESALADEALTASKAAEVTARANFQDAQSHGFPKEGEST